MERHTIQGKALLRLKLAAEGFFSLFVPCDEYKVSNLILTEGIK